MSRRYSDLERHLILQRFAANAFNITATSRETGVSERTLFRWQSKYFMSLTPQLTQSQEKPSLATLPQIPPLPESEQQALRDIQRQLMEKVNRLSHSIDEAIDEAPLAQRAVALSQLIDRVIKLASYLPTNPQVEILEGEDFTLEDAYNWQPPTPAATQRG